MRAIVQGHFKRTTRLWGLAALVAIGLSAETRPVLADEFVNTGYFGGVAIMGYDPAGLFHGQSGQ